jgi:hypothetical protein
VRSSNRAGCEPGCEFRKSYPADMYPPRPQIAPQVERLACSSPRPPVRRARETTVVKIAATQTRAAALHLVASDPRENRPEGSDG